MTALTDPISGLSYGWALGEDNWNTGMDANLVKIGAMLHINVLDFVATPVVTTNGTRYIVTTGSGAFAGQNNKLAARVAGAWVFYTLPEGCVVYDEDTNLHYKFEGGSYVLLVDLSAYLTSATAASTYLTTATAASTYGTIAQAKTEYLVLAASDESTALTTGTGKVTFRMPYAMTLTGVRCSLTTAQASGSIVTVDIGIQFEG